MIARMHRVTSWSRLLFRGASPTPQKRLLMHVASRPAVPRCGPVTFEHITRGSPHHPSETDEGAVSIAAARLSHSSTHRRSKNEGGHHVSTVVPTCHKPWSGPAQDWIRRPSCPSCELPGSP